MSPIDAAPNLTPNQINILIVLMAEAREVTNNELKELAGFTLTGTDNTKLVTLGLVETDRSHRPFSHQLTEKGWRLVRELHTTTPPKQGGSGSRSLFTLLGNVHRSLDRLHISYAEFFKQTPRTQPAQEHAAADDVETLIRTAYDGLAKSPGGWVGLADLRQHLGGVDPAKVDEALRALLHQDGVRIIPVANSKALQPRDRTAALRIGDEDNHTLSISPT